MKLSRFGIKFTSRSGILSLMDDLGTAMSSGQEMLMLGGGNPGHIPEVERRFRERMLRILEHPGEFERMIGNYAPPSGDLRFKTALAGLLRREFGWDVGAANVALTNGSQSAFFMLFNLFAGELDDGGARKILLPLTPEYIGYADIGLNEEFFVSARPAIELIDDHRFKYHVDFGAIGIGSDVGAICVSRPTNPTGNVLGDGEVEKLVELARSHDLPLIVDNAYGTPFPSIIFTDVRPVWTPNVVVCMSLSKLGLPGLRTGIVIADEPVIEALSGINAILNLATGNAGPILALDLVQSGEVLGLSHTVIRPYYEAKAARALEVLDEELAGYDYRVHKPEGAIFLWLWLRGLPITSEELYQRLKRRNVLVISGHYFFPGLRDAWKHRDECIRVTYSQDSETVERGLRIIAEEVRNAYQQPALAP